MNETFGLVILGLTAGVLSGLLGIGGAIIVIPALVFVFGYTQHRAEGTTLAMMVPPIGILALMPYWKRGHVDARAAALICVGFLIGGLIGGQLSVAMSGATLQRLFAVLLIVIAVKLLLK
jgi:uncharacterized membrane protein YfcA